MLKIKDNINLKELEKYGFTYSGQIRNAGIKFGKKISLNAYQIIYDRVI